MKGYVENKTPMWAHAMKRSIGPGQKVELDDLYEQYGAKHNLEKGEEFVNWLKTVKLRDNSRWNVVFHVGEEKEEKEEKKIKEKPKDSIDSIRTKGPASRNTEKPRPSRKIETTTYTDDSRSKREDVDVLDKNIKDLNVEDVVLLSVRKAREVVPKITDKKLLRYALEEAGTRSQKDSLCLILRKRIRELDTSSRQ